MEPNSAHDPAQARATLVGAWVARRRGRGRFESGVARAQFLASAAARTNNAQLGTRVYNYIIN